MAIDTHAHLYWDSFSADLDQVLQRAKDAGITAAINIGADFESSQKSVNQAIDPAINAILPIYAAIGIHPHQADKFCTDESIHTIIGNLANLYQKHPEKIVAIGECGLDYYFDKNPDFSPSDLTQEQLLQAQLTLYKTQVKLAASLKLPVIIHCRETNDPNFPNLAWQDIFIPELSLTSGVFHSFTGNLKAAQKAIELGYYISFSCIVTYPKNQQLREVITQIPLENILTETDCPFLPPQQIRGQRNEPAHTMEVVKIIADVKQITKEEVINQTTQNAYLIFAEKLQI